MVVASIADLLPHRLLRLVMLAAFLTVAVSLAGCEEEPDEPLRIGLVVWPPYEMAFLAQDLGYYEGANIQLVDYGSPAEFVLAYQGGSLDGVATVFDYLLELQYDNPVQMVVLLIDESRGGDAVVVRPDLQSLADLRGRRIGYEASALGVYMLSRTLDHAGLDANDIIPVPVDLQDQETAFRNGDVDAVVTYEPTVSVLVGEGANVVFDSSEIPGEIIDLLMVREEVLDEKRQQLQIFVDGWFKAIDYMRQNPLDAARRVAAREGLTPEEFLRTFDKIRLFDRAENQRLLSPQSETMKQSLSRHRNVMIREGFLSGHVEVEGLFSDALVAE